MKKTNRSIFVLAALFCLMFAAVAKADNNNLKAGYAPGGGSTLLFIADDRKIFEKEGVHVDLIPFTSSSDGLNALNSGKIDVGMSFGTAAPLTFISNGSDFKIIGGMLSGGHPILTLPANKNKFKSIKDFKGKTVATARLYTSDVVWRGALKKAGIDPDKDVNIIEFKSSSDVLQAVKSGKVDVGIGASSILVKAKESGLSIVGWSNDFFPHHPCCRIVADGKAVDKNPKLYIAFLRAMIQAEKIRYQNPRLAVEITKKYLKIDDKMATDFTLEPHQESHIDPNKNGVDRMWNDMKAIHYISSDEDINKHINTKLYAAALNSLLKSNPKDKFYIDAKKRFQKQD